jgi:hypothetical protein
MVFELFERSMSDIIDHYKRKKFAMEENLLIKILKYSMQAFMSCKKANMYYPEFCLGNLFVNEQNNLNVSKSDIISKSNSNSNIKEVKYMHPFLFKNFFLQIELKNNSDHSNIKSCNIFLIENNFKINYSS